MSTVQETRVRKASKKERRLTLKERAVVKEYVANGGNGTKAVLKVYNTDDPLVAGTMAPEILARPRVQTEIERILDKVGDSDEFALGRLHDVLAGTAIRTSSREILDNDGKVIKLVETKPPTHTDTIRAIDLRYKISGHYAKTQAAADVCKQREYQALRRRWLGRGAAGKANTPPDA